MDMDIMSKTKICPVCKGEKTVECPECKGKGEIKTLCPHCSGTGEGKGNGVICGFCKKMSGEVTVECPVCGGKCVMDCSYCDGVGEVEDVTGSDGLDWPLTADPKVWAEQLSGIFGASPHHATDEKYLECLLNAAIEAGKNSAEKGT
jgi:hypothetical protein